MGLKKLLIKSTTLVVALALGLGACAIAYAAIEIAWLALGVGVFVASASAWRLLGAVGTATLTPTTASGGQDLWATEAGEFVDLNTVGGRATFAHDGISRRNNTQEDS